MPKNIHTPRDELICGKLDELETHLCGIAEIHDICMIGLAHMISDIRHDAERMEAKLVSRKDESLAPVAAVAPEPELPCTCGDRSTIGVFHRVGSPCFWMEPAPLQAETAQVPKDFNDWKTNPPPKDTTVLARYDEGDWQDDVTEMRVICADVQGIIDMSDVIEQFDADEVFITSALAFYDSIRKEKP